jgi:hypothetical protein
VRIADFTQRLSQADSRGDAESAEKYKNGELNRVSTSEF